MSAQPRDFRRVVCSSNRGLIESWCPLCGIFIAASSRPDQLAVAERLHLRVCTKRRQPDLPLSSHGGQPRSSRS